MFWRVGTVLALVALIGAPTAGWAEKDEGRFSEPGFYIGGGYGSGWNQYAGGDRDSFGADPGVGVNFWGGYRFHPHFAAELQIEYLNDLGGTPLVSSDPTAESAFSDSTDVLNFTINYKGYLMTKRFQPFTLIGLGGGWLQNKAPSSSDRFEDSWGAITARFGGGIDIYLLDNLAFEAACTYAMTISSKQKYSNLHNRQRFRVDYLSLNLGVQYRF